MIQATNPFAQLLEVVQIARAEQRVSPFVSIDDLFSAWQSLGSLPGSLPSLRWCCKRVHRRSWCIAPMRLILRRFACACRQMGRVAATHCWPKASWMVHWSLNCAGQPAVQCSAT